MRIAPRLAIAVFILASTGTGSAAPRLDEGEWEFGLRMEWK